MANWAAAIGNIFTGGFVSSLERIALEAIETDKESAEAKAIRVKTLDPNGMMRRDIMRFIMRVYGFYLVMAVPLIVLSYFGIGDVDTETTKMVLQAISDTFAPITGLFTVLAAASFGVNVSNNNKDIKMNKRGEISA